MLGNRSVQSPNSTKWTEAFAGNICQVLLMVLLVILISLGNLVSLLVFFRIRQFRTSQGYLRASLALADLAVGLLGVPYSIYREVSQLAYGAGEEIHLFEKPACFVSGVVFASCTFVSISTILLLSVERSVAVLKPLHRKVVITKRRTVGLILASWAVSFCMALIPLLSSPNISLQYNSCSKMCNYAFTEDKLTTSHWNIMLLYPIFDFSVLSGAFIVNAVTFLAIHRYCKKRKQLGAEQQGGNQLSFSDITAAKTIGIVTFAFSASFLPIAVFVVGSVVGYQWCQFSFYAFWILTSNSCWNVGIYSIWDPKFRQGVWDLFGKQAMISISQPSNCSPEECIISAPSWVIVLKKFFHPAST